MQQGTSISLNLSLEEVNAILSALGEHPYIQVYELIQKIQHQAGEQVQQQANLSNAPTESETV